MLDVAPRRARAARSRSTRRPGEPLGVEVHSALFDQVRTCDNHCEFCFIYQLPPGLRKSLYLKDDDYRLSFLYGNFTTLTRFTEADLERVVTERLSPLHVSIHATDPEVRARDAPQPAGRHQPAVAARPARPRHRGARPGRRVPRAQRRRRARRHAGRRARPLPRAGVARASCRSGSAGTTPSPRMRPHTGRGGRRRRRHRRGLAGRLPRRARPTPRVRRPTSTTCSPSGPSRPPTRYEGFPMHEDGIGMARTFELELFGQKADATGTQDGFFAWADGGDARPVDGSGSPTRTTSPTAASEPPLTSSCRSARRARRRSASSPAPTAPGAGAAARPARAGRTCASCRSTTSSSAATPASPACWSGRTSPARWPREPAGHRYLLPDVCLSNGRFLDGGAAGGPAPARRGRSPPTVTPSVRPSGSPAEPWKARDDHVRPSCRRSPSSAVPTSASPRSSTASSASAWPSSRRSPASPATARRSRPSGSACRSASSTPAAGCRGGSDLDAKVSRQSEQAIRDADAVSCVVDAVTGVTEEDARVAEVVRDLARGKVLVVVNKVDDAGREGLHLGGHVASGSVSRCPISALHGRGSGDVLDRLIELLPTPDPIVETEDDDDEEPEERVFSVALVGRPERRQVDAVQPPHRRGAGRRPRPAGHDPRHRSTRSSRPPTARSASSTPRACGARRRSTRRTEYYSLVRALQAVDQCRRRAPRDRRHGRRHRPGPAPRRAHRRRRQPRSSCCSTSGSCSPTPRPAPTSTGRSHERLRVHRRRSRAQDLGPHRQGRAQAAARPVAEHRGLPPPGPDAPRQRGHPRRPAGPARSRTASRCSTPRRPPPTRRPSRCSPTASSRRRTCATSSAGSARASTSAPPRSRCASGSDSAQATVAVEALAQPTVARTEWTRLRPT